MCHVCSQREACQGGVIHLLRIRTVRETQRGPEARPQQHSWEGRLHPKLAVWFQTRSILRLMQWAFELGGGCLAVGLLEILGALSELCGAELVCPRIYLLR